jgi:drug/metabolite transporter (DMT)-like permease
VNAFYFAAIKRLGVGVALTVQYLGPVLLMLWLRVVHHRSLSKSIWTAAAITVTGCFFIVRTATTRPRRSHGRSDSRACSGS